MPQKEKAFKVTISVLVDDASKPEYEDAMKKVCDQTFNELRAILRSIDRGTGRVTVNIQPIVE